MTATRAAIYCRVSTEDQATEGTSLDTQLERCRAAIAAKGGWSEVGVFTDDGVSGAKANRPALDRLMQVCRSGDVDVIVVAKLDRFSRSVAHLSAAVAELDALGVALATADGSVDGTTPSGRMMRNLLGVFAEFEREQIIERTSAGLRRAVQDGYWPGGPPPYGFRTVPVEGTKHKCLAVDDAEAEMLRKAVSLIVDDGCSTWEAARLLNALGYSPRKASRWTHHNLRRTLLDSRLSGTWHYGRPPGWGRGDSTGEIEVTIPQIIDPKRHAALRSALKATSTGPRRPEDDGFYLLSRGLLFGTCGSTMHGVYRKDRDRRQYRCANSRPEAEHRCDDMRLNADDAEAAVWEAVVDLLAQPERLMSLAQDYLGLRDQQAEVEHEQIERLETKVASLEQARTDTAVRALKAGMDPELMKQAVGQIEDELAGLRQRLAQLQTWQANADAESDRMARLRELAKVAHRRLLVMPATQKRAVLDLLDVRVVVAGWGSCVECRGKGKVRGGTGGLPCPVCKSTRNVPLLRISGTVYDRLLDAVDVGELADGALRPCRCCSPCPRA